MRTGYFQYFQLLKGMALVVAVYLFPGQVFAQRYVAYSELIENSEAPWIFDGRQVTRGKVVSISYANTEENRRACANEWKRIRSHRALCTNLPDLIIVTVQLTDLNKPSLLFVPVSRIAKISPGDDVLVRTAEISADNAVQSLPVFVRVLPRKGQN